jgi:hypothetical protein
MESDGISGSECWIRPVPTGCGLIYLMRGSSLMIGDCCQTNKHGKEEEHDIGARAWQRSESIHENERATMELPPPMVLLRLDAGAIPVMSMNSAFGLAMAAAASGNIRLMVVVSRPELHSVTAPSDGGGAAVAELQRQSARS